jgi:hypothetical protein
MRGYSSEGRTGNNRDLIPDGRTDAHRHPRSFRDIPTDTGPPKDAAHNKPAAQATAAHPHVQLLGSLPPRLHRALVACAWRSAFASSGTPPHRPLGERRGGNGPLPSTHPPPPFAPPSGDGSFHDLRTGAAPRPRPAVPALLSLGPRRPSRDQERPLRFAPRAALSRARPPRGTAIVHHGFLSSCLWGRLTSARPRGELVFVACDTQPRPDREPYPRELVEEVRHWAPPSPALANTTHPYAPLRHRRLFLCSDPPTLDPARPRTNERQVRGSKRFFAALATRRGARGPPPAPSRSAAGVRRFLLFSRRFAPGAGLLASPVFHSWAGRSPWWFLFVLLIFSRGLPFLLVAARSRRRSRPRETRIDPWSLPGDDQDIDAAPRGPTIKLTS